MAINIVKNTSLQQVSFNTEMSLRQKQEDQNLENQLGKRTVGKTKKIAKRIKSENSVHLPMVYKDAVQMLTGLPKKMVVLNKNGDAERAFARGCLGKEMFEIDFDKKHSESDLLLFAHMKKQFPEHLVKPAVEPDLVKPAVRTKKNVCYFTVLSPEKKGPVRNTSNNTAEQEALQFHYSELQDYQPATNPFPTTFLDNKVDPSFLSSLPTSVIFKNFQAEFNRCGNDHPPTHFQKESGRFMPQLVQIMPQLVQIMPQLVQRESDSEPSSPDFQMPSSPEFPFPDFDPMEES